MSTDQIFALGDDQLSNQYVVVFPNGIPGGGDDKAVSLRMDQSFQAPEETVNTYDIVYKGMKITKTGMLHETDKSYTTDVRIDQQWKAYDALHNWFKMCYDPINGTALPDASVRTTLLVQAQDGQNKTIKTIRFKNAKIKSLALGSFDHTNGDPLRVTIGFIYQDMIFE